jgi:hypothetical protein
VAQSRKNNDSVSGKAKAVKSQRAECAGIGLLPALLPRARIDLNIEFQPGRNTSK